MIILFKNYIVITIPSFLINCSYCTRSTRGTCDEKEFRIKLYSGSLNFNKCCTTQI